MLDEANAIAAAVIQQFERLPSKRKPCVRDNGVHEWVPLSGIVANNRASSSLTCLSLATGMKCLPVSKLPQSNGVAIHDWHAEVLAIRAFNHFVMEECRGLARGEPSDFVRWKSRTGEEASGLCPCETQPFCWREGVTLHMYCSEAPCGDASMELTMAAQKDASPWDVPGATATTADGDAINALPGRAYFSQLGVVRRKPARPDAPPSLSKSCSDKLASKQCTSLLASLPSVLVSPQGMYLDSVVLPASQFSTAACTRSFSVEGRMRSLAGRRWEGGYSFVPFRVETTAMEFAFSKQAVAARSDRTVASNLAVAWSRRGLDEGIVGGVLQGCKRFDLRGASAVSRREMWSLLCEILSETGLSPYAAAGVQAVKLYQDIKEVDLLKARRAVKGDVRKEALNGWIRNIGDANFSL